MPHVRSGGPVDHGRARLVHVRCPGVRSAGHGAAASARVMGRARDVHGRVGMPGASPGEGARAMRVATGAECPPRCPTCGGLWRTTPHGVSCLTCGREVVITAALFAAHGLGRASLRPAPSPPSAPLSPRIPEPQASSNGQGPEHVLDSDRARAMGQKSALARQVKLTPAKRQAIARLAARARWGPPDDEAETRAEARARTQQARLRRVEMPGPAAGLIHAEGRCPSCGTVRGLRLNGTFRVHSLSRLCSGSGQPGTPL